MYFNLQYGTNYIAVMPTNLYGPNDNFDLERSHVLPAMIRKIHLSKCLQSGDWEAIRRDLQFRPIEKIDGGADELKILHVLEKYGIRRLGNYVELELWGTGKPLREFLWSEEMADACVFVMEKINFTDLFVSGEREIRNCHINIGTGSELTIAELAQLIAETVEFSGSIRFDATKPDGTMRKLTDVSKLNSLGWRHQVDVEEGVKRMYEWYKTSIK